jgi:hypothetical protein
MRIALLLTLTALAVGGCAKEVWHRQEVVDWSEMWIRPPQQLRYCGSDAQWHYFLAHPIDDWVCMKVPRGEIKMPEELPPTKAGTWHYPVDPSHGFRRISE